MRKLQAILGAGIPRIVIHNTAIADDAWEAEGRVLHVVCFGFVFEIGLSRIVERYDHD